MKDFCLIFQKLLEIKVLYHSTVRWAIQAQSAEPLVFYRSEWEIDHRKKEAQRSQMGCFHIYGINNLLFICLFDHVFSMDSLEKSIFLLSTSNCFWNNSFFPWIILNYIHYNISCQCFAVLFHLQVHFSNCYGFHD